MTELTEPGVSTAADDLRFQGDFGGREDDCVDEAADRIGRFGPGVGMLECLREIRHLLPVQLRHSRMQQRRRLVG